MEVTGKMIDAGQVLAANLVSANIEKTMGVYENPPGGTRKFSLENYDKKFHDLIVKYINGEIESTEAIFTAMYREMETSKIVEIKSLAEIKELFPRGATKDTLAKYYGLTNYDMAIPQTLFDQLATDKFNPWGFYVYDYSRWTFGVLFPLTTEAIVQMENNLDKVFIDPRVE